MGRTYGLRNPNHMLPSAVFGTPGLNLSGRAKCQHQAGERTKARRTPQRGTKLSIRLLQLRGSCDQRRHRQPGTALGEFLSDPTPPRCCQRAEMASRTNTRSVHGEVTDPFPPSQQEPGGRQEPGLGSAHGGPVQGGTREAHPRRLVLAQSKTLCTAVTPSRPMGATSPPVMMA